MPGCRKKVTGTRKKMECTVQGCTGHREEPSNKHCRNHTCANFHTDGCTNKKPAGDTVCQQHMRCPQQPCNKARIQYANGERGRFCYDHKCSADDCQELRSFQQNQYRLYCNRHGCHVAHCRERAFGQPGIRFIYCSTHKCRQCGQMAVSPAGLCERHNECGRPGCRNQREGARDLCSEHLQCETAGCRVPKKAGSSHCDNHTCRERDCRNSSGAHSYCEDHRCEKYGCSERRRMGAMRFCALHSCQTSGCQRPKCDRGQHCDTHTCSDRNCGNPKVFGDLCQHHFGESCRQAARIDWSDEQQRLRDDLAARDRDLALRDTYLRANLTVLEQRDEEIRRLQQRLNAQGVDPQEPEGGFPPQQWGGFPGQRGGFQGIGRGFGRHPN
ncbi:hypothetical protein F4818DRAFT_18359 [Hypoxylon cercidicola]|nr:hypothetical protein F4818DRAFT_18359 [Hypoxylon cercidicola]